MKVRRTHSSIDTLPAALQKALEAMLVDNQWPADYAAKKTGKPKYGDLERYCRQHNFEISKSAIGRFGLRMRTLAKMKEAGLIVRSVFDGLDAEHASQTQKAVAELLTARAIELAAEKSLNSKQIREVAGAMRDCAGVSIKADTHRQAQQKKKADEAAKNIEALADKKQISPETLKIIREQIYGIVS
ncbi:MAG TPA: hypothetical protein DCP47_06150 [Phycisphaerales bacterium]|nr:hypothetical protein [Phycisphaerales bacterium]